MPPRPSTVYVDMPIALRSWTTANSNQHRDRAGSVISRLFPLDLGWVSYREFNAHLAGDVKCGRDLQAHTDLHVLRKVHLDWASAFDICDDARVQQLGFWRLWSDCALGVSAADATVIANYCLMYTVLDDTAEGYFDSGSLNALDLALRDFGSVLGGRRRLRGAAAAFAQYDRLCAVMADLRERLLQLDRFQLMPLLVQGFDSYRRGVLQQAYLARRGARVSRETQLYNRLLNVAFDPTVLLLCIANQIPFPRSVDEHPMFERLHMAICRMGAIINDLISFPKEAAAGVDSGTSQNTIAASFGDFAEISQIANPLKVAIRRTFEFHNAEFMDCLELGKLVSDDSPELEPYVQLGVDMHRSWMDWCLKASRYTSALRFESGIQVTENALSLSEDGPSAHTELRLCGEATGTE